MDEDKENRNPSSIVVGGTEVFPASPLNLPTNDGRPLTESNLPSR